MARAQAVRRAIRLDTRFQSGDAERAERPATTAQSTGLRRATARIHDGARSAAIMVEDRNVRGRTMKLATPMRASGVRRSRARALEKEAKAALTRTAHSTTTSRPRRPPG